MIQAGNSGRQPRICVVGSLNQDLLATVDRLPGRGETVHAVGFEEQPGGKGANQAVAAARLGAHVQMVGAVGTDGAGAQLLAALAAAGVDTGHVTHVDGSSGLALITVGSDDVTIAVVAGANGKVSETTVQPAEPAIAASEVLLLQGEVPAAAARAAAECARKNGTLVVFNPAPFNQVAAAVAPLADVMIVNQTEADQLRAQSLAVNPQLLATITTLGAEGCAVTLGERVEPLDHPRTFDVAAPEVDAVDATGAGDAFCGAVAVVLAEAMADPRQEAKLAGEPSAPEPDAAVGVLRADDFVRAATFGVHAGALAVTALGAQPAMANRAQVLELMAAGDQP